MSNDSEWERAKRELHRQIDNLGREEAINLSKSWTQFKEWARGILRRIGIFLDDIFDAIAESLSVLWEGIKRAFS